MLEFARALMVRPRLILLDEPFANIDPISVFELKQMIRQLAERGISILITDHNAREIFSVVHRSYLIQHGQVMLSGPVEELINDDEARRTYLGEDFRL